MDRHFRLTLLPGLEARAELGLILKLLIKGADPNEKAKDGWAPLHCAAFLVVNSEVVESLIRFGANAHAETKVRLYLFIYIYCFSLLVFFF
jgi:ankyrin repeat protein